MKFLKRLTWLSVMLSSNNTPLRGLLFENLKTKRDLADSLSVSISTIDRLMKKGLPYHKIGRSVRFNLNDVKDYLQDWRQNGLN